MTGQWKFTKNNIRQIEFNTYSSPSIKMKTRQILTPITGIVINKT